MKAIGFNLLKTAIVIAAFVFLRGEHAVPARPADQPPVGYANPAALYCTGLGYSYEIQHAASGDVGFCTLPDSQTCDEWDFLAGKCGAAYSVCAQRGYQTATRNDGSGPYGPAYAVCLDQAGNVVGTVDQLADLQERAVKTGCTQKPPVSIEQGDAGPDVVLETLPASFDWRAQPKGNYLTNVRDQGQCGSCWAFSAVGVTEAALNIANDMVGNNFNLAEQYLVSDCSGAGSCCGGWAYMALDYIRTSGLPDEACMPYVDGGYPSGCQCNGSCSANCTYRTSGRCSDKTCGERCSNYSTRLIKLKNLQWAGYDPSTIKSLLITKGPLSVTLSMNGSWSGDVFQCAAGAQVNHAVVLVGYDDPGGYWIVRNSWGSTWNGDGYFKVGYGQCSIEDEVYYVTVSSMVPAPQKPAATITDRTPTYVWSKVANASQYQLQLLRDTTVVYTKTVSSSGCSTSTCSNTPSSAVPYGFYRWQIRAYVGGEWRAFSAVMSFTIVNPTIPRTIAPMGTVADTTPTFSWTKVSGATRYQYQLLSGSTVVYTKSTYATVCGTSKCSRTPAKVLAPGSYIWRVRSYKDGAWRPYSAYASFVIP